MNNKDYLKSDLQNKSVYIDNQNSTIKCLTPEKDHVN
jgi:hypothetical protein